MQPPESYLALLRAGYYIRLRDGQPKVGPGAGPAELVTWARQEKEAIVAYLEERDRLLLAPWPTGFGGLAPGPQFYMEAQERCDRWGISDPLVRRYNILSWASMDLLRAAAPGAQQVIEARRCVFREMARLDGKTIWCPTCGDSYAILCETCNGMVCTGCLQCSPGCPLGEAEWPHQFSLLPLTT